MSPVPTPASPASRPQLIDAEMEPAPAPAPLTRETPITPPRAPQRQMYGAGPLAPPAQSLPSTRAIPSTEALPPAQALPPSPSFSSPQTGFSAPTGPPPIHQTAATGGPSSTTSVGVVRKRRSPLLIATGAFALGGLVGAGGFGLGMRYDDAGSDAANPVVNVTAPAADRSSGPTGTEVLPIPDRPVPDAADSDSTLAPLGTEPAADVARILGPSVVQVETNLGQGSGVIYADGLLLTNHHVIDGASRVQVRTSDGRVFETEVLGSDARNDIAVLSAPGSDLPIATLGSSAALQPGQLTVAIGSPFQLQQTVTAGIVSSVNRPVPNATGSYSAMIQTDAPINPGNSGGALANRNGELVGINASIRTDGTSNSNVGIGFAVPIDTAIRVAERIVSGESLDPGTLGVTAQPQDDGIGVLVNEVTADSGAEAAGLLTGDRVVTIEGAPVTNIRELSGLVQSYFIGDTVRLEIIRGGTEVIIEAVLR